MAKIKICLDAGHYAKYNRSPVVKEYYESEMNWKLHNLLKKYLEQYGIEVTQTRSDPAKDMELTARGRVSKGCDLFISIHSNACDTESVDYPVVIVPLNGKGDKIGQKLADCVTDVMGTKQKGRIYKRQGNNGDYYGVIRGAVAVGTVGIIIEHSFHTNTAAAKWLLIDSNLDKMAKAEADAIAAYYGIAKPVAGDSSGGTSAPADPASVLFRCQVGAYTVREYADDMMRKVKAAGFDTYMVKVDGLLKIQVGAFSKKPNADAMLDRLKKAGFDGFITTKSGTPVAADPVKKSVEELAQEVIQGKWGNGTDRKNRLTAAGYDYAAVQKRVNALMKG